MKKKISLMLLLTMLFTTLITPVTAQIREKIIQNDSNEIQLIDDLMQDKNL